MAASASQPLFHGGQLFGQLDQAEGKQLEMLQAYRKAVLSAFSDVEQALVAVQQEALRERYQREVVRASQRAFDISYQRLQQGTLDMVTLTQTQQTLFTAQDLLARSACCACRRRSALSGARRRLVAARARRPLHALRHSAGLAASAKAAGSRAPIGVGRGPGRVPVHL
jgi:hypothetical protein